MPEVVSLEWTPLEVGRWAKGVRPAHAARKEGARAHMGHCALGVWCRCARRSAFSRPVLGTHGGGGASGRGGAPSSSGRHRGACAPCVCPLPVVLAPPAAQCSAPMRARTPSFRALARRAHPLRPPPYLQRRPLQGHHFGHRLPSNLTASSAIWPNSTRKVLFFASLFGRFDLFRYICSV